MAEICGKAGTATFSVTAACMNVYAWTLDITADEIDVTGFGDTCGTFVYGIPKYTGTASGYMDATTQAPKLAATGQAGTTIDFTFTQDTTLDWIGIAGITGMSLAVDANGTADCSITLRGTGVLTTA